MCELLLSSKSNPDNAEGGRGPLHLAAMNGFDCCMGVLLHHGAKIDLVTSEGDNAIHLACAESELEATRLLLDGGIDPDIRDGKGNTPLSHAVRGRNGTNALPVCELLLKHHANPELKTQ